MLRSNILNNEHWIKKTLNIKSIKISDLFSTQNVFNYYLKLLSQQVWPTEWPSLAELKHKNSLLLRDTLLFQNLIILWREAKGLNLTCSIKGWKDTNTGMCHQSDTAAVWRRREAAASQLQSYHIRSDN